MSKVNWATVSSWANWYTEDKEGGVFWESEPDWDPKSDIFVGGFIYSDKVFDSVCHKYIEKRPTEGDTHED